MNANEILLRTKEIYRECSSYSDSGIAQLVPPISKTNLEFATFFVRPNKFRFEWRDWHPYFGKELPPTENALWTDGKRTRTKFLGKIISEKSLGFAVAGATGVSFGTVLLISKLLMGNYIESSLDWFNMSDPRILDEEVVGNSPCYHLVGTVESTDDHDAWIDIHEFLVRRLSHKIARSKDETEGLRQEALRVLKKQGVQECDLPNFEALTRQNVYNFKNVQVNGAVDPSLFEVV